MEISELRSVNILIVTINKQGSGTRLALDNLEENEI